jgi:hypothetical protein
MGGFRRQVDGTAGLPSAPEMLYKPRQLRLVPEAEQFTSDEVEGMPGVFGRIFPR